MTSFDDRFEHEGHKFGVTFPADDDYDAPWDREDGHGQVSEWRRVGYSGNPLKAPGELILARDGRMYRVYDFAGACKLALKDGWGTSDSEGLSRKAIAAKAAREDFDRMRQFIDGQWCYVGVVVELLDDDDGATGITESLWGIESDSKEYLAEVMHELAEGILQTVESAAKKA